MKKKLYTLYLTIVRGSVVAAVTRFVSPLFLVMFCASFIFWFVAKLGYNYTAELDITLRVEDETIKTTCVVEGVGTNLLGYHIYKGGAVKINLDEVKHRIVRDKNGEQYIRFDRGAVSNLLSVHYSDIKLVSMESLPDMRYSDRIKESLK